MYVHAHAHVVIKNLDFGIELGGLVLRSLSFHAVQFVLQLLKLKVLLGKKNPTQLNHWKDTLRNQINPSALYLSV